MKIIPLLLIITLGCQAQPDIPGHDDCYSEDQHNQEIQDTVSYYAWLVQLYDDRMNAQDEYITNLNYVIDSLNNITENFIYADTVSVQLVDTTSNIILDLEKSGKNSIFEWYLLGNRGISFNVTDSILRLRTYEFIDNVPIFDNKFMLTYDLYDGGLFRVTYEN